MALFKFFGLVFPLKLLPQNQGPIAVATDVLLRCSADFHVHSDGVWQRDSRLTENMNERGFFQA
jgi:hypothetical protein